MLSTTIVKKGSNMTIKVFKRADTARSIAHQDSLLSGVVPNFPKVPTFVGKEEIPMMFRKTNRKERDEIYVASLALIGDTEKEVKYFMSLLKERKAILHCVEEGVKYEKITPRFSNIKTWKAARHKGAAMRGAIKSATTRKKATAEALAKIDHELKSTDIPTATLLAKVGIYSVNTIKNHYGVNRTTLKSNYQAAQKRKKRND